MADEIKTNNSQGQSYDRRPNNNNRNRNRHRPYRNGNYQVTGTQGESGQNAQPTQAQASQRPSQNVIRGTEKSNAQINSNITNAQNNPNLQNRDRQPRFQRDRYQRPYHDNRDTQKVEETAEDIARDNEKIAREIELEIRDISALKLGI